MHKNVDTPPTPVSALRRGDNAGDDLALVFYAVNWIFIKIIVFIVNLIVVLLL
jgi:hypothetical protein